MLFMAHVWQTYSTADGDCKSGLLLVAKSVLESMLGLEDPR
jgi:hypothetical protein